MAGEMRLKATRGICARVDAPAFDKPIPSSHGAEPKQTRRRPQIHANLSQGAPIAVLSDPKRLVAYPNDAWRDNSLQRSREFSFF